MFTRCIHCGWSKGLSKYGKREYSCNKCTFIHTKSAAKTVAGMSDERWAEFSAERRASIAAEKAKVAASVVKREAAYRKAKQSMKMDDQSGDDTGNDCSDYGNN